MYALSMGAGTTLGMPDVCLTPAGPAMVPVPYPNIAQSGMAPSSVMTVLLGATPTLNQMSSISLSSGDEVGAATGVVSHMIKGQNPWILGSTGFLVGGTPCMRLTATGGGNAAGVMPNCPSVCIVPSQVSVLVLR